VLLHVERAVDRGRCAEAEEQRLWTWRGRVWVACKRGAIFVKLCAEGDSLAISLTPGTLHDVAG